MRKNKAIALLICVNLFLVMVGSAMATEQIGLALVIHGRGGQKLAGGGLIGGGLTALGGGILATSTAVEVTMIGLVGFGLIGAGAGILIG